MSDILSKISTVHANKNTTVTMVSGFLAMIGGNCVFMKKSN